MVQPPLNYDVPRGWRAQLCRAVLIHKKGQMAKVKAGIQGVLE